MPHSPTNKAIYFLPGLGADKRLFEFIELEGIEKVCIKFPKPDLSESISDYSRRLIHQIKHKDPILCGVSMGGILACEIAKIISVEKVILISSIKSVLEKPRRFNVIKWLPFTDLLPIETFKNKARLMNQISLGSQKGNDLFYDMLEDTDSDLLKWGIKQVGLWDNKDEVKNLIHIHGDRDEIFPIAKVKADFVIKGGSHFMIVDRAEEINGLLENIVFES